MNLAKTGEHMQLWQVWGMPNPSSKGPKRPTDPFQLAKVIGDLATGQAEPEPAPTQDEIRWVMAALGRAGGLWHGKARAASMTAKKRSDIAKNAAAARWGKKS